MSKGEGNGGAGGILSSDWAQPPTVDQELYEAYPEHPKVDYGFDPLDSMPRPVVPASLKLAQAPPLLPETLICMADTSEFVIRSVDGELQQRFDPERVERLPTGRFRVTVQGALNMDVEPVRPRCKHYRRQMCDVADDPDFRILARLCTARRDDEGEFLSLRDRQVFACELRDPPDLTGSVKLLDDFDNAQITRNRQVAAQAGQAFDVDAALAEQTK